MLIYYCQNCTPGHEDPETKFRIKHLGHGHVFDKFSANNNTFLLPKPVTKKNIGISTSIENITEGFFSNSPRYGIRGNYSNMDSLESALSKSENRKLAGYPIIGSYEIAPMTSDCLIRNLNIYLITSRRSL